MDELGELLQKAASVAADYRASLAKRPVAPVVDRDALRAAFGGPLQSEPRDARDVLDELVAAAEPGLVASAGPRFFGFVIGGALDAATAADIVAAGWDQCGFNAVLSPATAAAEVVAGARAPADAHLGVQLVHHRCRRRRVGRGRAPRGRARLTSGPLRSSL